VYPSVRDFDLVANGLGHAASVPWSLEILPRLFGPRARQSVLPPGHRVISSRTLGHSQVGPVEHMSGKSASASPSADGHKTPEPGSGFAYQRHGEYAACSWDECYLANRRGECGEELLGKLLSVNPLLLLLAQGKFDSTYVGGTQHPLALGAKDYNNAR
jgi:hypothetical protein